MEPLVNATAAILKPSLFIVASQNNATWGSTYPCTNHKTSMDCLEDFTSTNNRFKFIHGDSPWWYKFIVMVSQPTWKKCIIKFYVTKKFQDVYKTFSLSKVKLGNPWQILKVEFFTSVKQSASAKPCFATTIICKTCIVNVVVYPLTKSSER